MDLLVGKKFPPPSDNLLEVVEVYILACHLLNNAFYGALLLHLFKQLQTITEIYWMISTWCIQLQTYPPTPDSQSRFYR